MQRLHALLLLALAFVRSIVAPLFGRRRGLKEFEASYASDRLPPVTPEERETLALLSGCIACGLCDIGKLPKGAFAGTMDLMLASSRNMPDFDAALISFAQVNDAELASLEKSCPTRVPMRKVATFVRAKAELVRKV